MFEGLAARLALGDMGEGGSRTRSCEGREEVLLHMWPPMAQVFAKALSGWQEPVVG